VTVTIQQSRYKDRPAVTLESEALAAQFLPGAGAKLCSLLHKRSGTELLLQRPGETYRLSPYDGDNVGDYVGECSGADEMFPKGQRSWPDGDPRPW